MIDLFSLEPIDQLNRPLRLKTEVRTAVNQLKKQIRGRLNFQKVIESEIQQELFYEAGERQ